MQLHKTMNGLKVLDRNALKIIAIIAMVMDHIAPIVFESNSLWWNIFRIIGRLTFTIMIYFLAEGFRYTRNLFNFYELRLQYLPMCRATSFELSLHTYRIQKKNDYIGINAIVQFMAFTYDIDASKFLLKQPEPSTQQKS